MMCVLSETCDFNLIYGMTFLIVIADIINRYISYNSLYGITKVAWILRIIIYEKHTKIETNVFEMK